MHKRTQRLLFVIAICFCGFVRIQASETENSQLLAEEGGEIIKSNS
jgi:hypothetical protein